MNEKNFTLRGGTFDLDQSSAGPAIFGGVSSTLYGTAVVVEGQPVLTGGPITAQIGTLTGLLQNNTAPVTFFFGRESNSPINLVIVPEPAALGLMACEAVTGLRRPRCS